MLLGLLNVCTIFVMFSTCNSYSSCFTALKGFSSTVTTEKAAKLVTPSPLDSKNESTHLRGTLFHALASL